MPPESGDERIIHYKDKNHSCALLECLFIANKATPSVNQWTRLKSPPLMWSKGHF